MHPNFYNTAVKSVTMPAQKRLESVKNINVAQRAKLSTVCYSVNGVVRSEAMPHGAALTKAYALAKVYTKVWVLTAQGGSIQIGKQPIVRG